MIFLWIVFITLFSIFGSWYASRFNNPNALIGLYVAFVLISNILAYKIIELNLGFLKVYVTAATLIFAVTFLLTDIVNEKFGRKETQKMILIALISQIAVIFFIWMAISFDPAPFWQDQTSFQKILGFAPRVILASLVAFFISENMDAYIYAWFKKLTGERHLWARNVLSSIPAMAIDTIIFVFLAFYGVQPIFSLIIGMILIKWLVGIIDIPFMYINRQILYWKK